MAARPEKQIRLRGRCYPAHSWPLICTPLLATELLSLEREAAALVRLQPDLVEWRIDFFHALADTDQVLEALSAIRQILGDIPLLVTRRAQHEGGAAINLQEAEVVALYQALCASGQVDLIDYELSNPHNYWQQLRETSRQHGVLLIGSYHNFDATPELADLLGRFQAAADADADIAKVAVMPANTADVLRLLEASSLADQQLSIPVISMSMAELGVVSRLMGGRFGSCLTFAVGTSASAPGQVPIAEVKQVRQILQRSNTGAA